MQRRRLLALGMLAGWLCVVGWHVRREYFRPELAMLEEGARALAPGTHFYAIRMGDATIGTASTRLDTVPGGFQLDDNVLIDIPALDTVQRAVVVTRIELTAALAVNRFQFRMDSPIGSFAVAGVATSDSVLELEIGTAGEVRHEQVRVPGRITLDPVVGIRLAAAGALRAGRAASVRVFDPSTMSDRLVNVRVTRADTLIVNDSVGLADDGRWVALTQDTVPVWRIEQSFGGIALESWVDEDGMLVKATSPLGFTVERTAFEIARQEWQDARGRPELASGYGAVIEATAIASNVSLEGIETAPQLAVRLRGVDLGGFDLAGGRQELRSDTLIVSREAESAFEHATYALPYPGDGDARAELAATPLIQATHPDIIAAARDAVGGTSEPSEAARRLNDWVHSALRKEITPSMPSALNVLHARRGDCNEHTVLYVALARAIGLPARTAAGLVHVRGSFYYHAWPEVWLGERWVAVDPTLGQFPADASHLRFIVGGLARQVELIRLIGRLQLEVV